MYRLLLLCFSDCVIDDRSGLLFKIQVHLFLQSEDGTFYHAKFLLQSRGQVPPLTGLVSFRKKLQAVKGKNYVPEVTHPSMITELNVGGCKQVNK